MATWPVPATGQRRIAPDPEVDEQRADPPTRIGRGEFDQRQLDLLIMRSVVVQRDLCCRTDESVLAVSPVQCRRIGCFGERVEIRIGGAGIGDHRR